MNAAEVDATRIAEWRISGYPYKTIAAAIAEWALQQPHGTELPANDFFAGNLAIVASDSTWKRAKVFLRTVGVLYQGDGPYQVA